MSNHYSRRRFLSSASVGGSILTVRQLVAGLTPVSDDQVRVASGIVQLRPEIEPLVRVTLGTIVLSPAPESGVRNSPFDAALLFH